MTHQTMHNDRNSERPRSFPQATSNALNHPQSRLRSATGESAGLDHGRHVLACCAQDLTALVTGGFGI